MTRSRRLAAVLLTALALASCSSEDPVRDSAAPDPTPTEQEGSSSSPSAPAEEMTGLEVWFVTDNGVQATTHEVGAVEGIGAEAMRELLAGPVQPEADLGFSTAIPAGTELLGLDIAAGIATVDLSGNFDDGGGSASMLARVAQVVYTLTQFPTVDGVEFLVDGEPVQALGGEGLVLDEPQRRKDLSDELAPIVVLTPAIGSSHSDPIDISGTANVFEATVSLRLVTVGGEVLEEAFTTATCGSGCRGDYATTLAFEVDATTEAIIEVFESSAEDGSQLHLVEIPVTLEP